MASQRVPAGVNGAPLQGAAPAAAVSACLRVLLAAFVWLCLLAPVSRAQPVPGEVSITIANGFARLLFHLRSEVAAEFQMANGILIVNFAQPVDVNVDRLNTSAPDYVSAARLDPDGLAVRIALARKVTANLLPANERLFLDLLPESWTGLAPGLPKEVVEELTRRTREAERRARLQRQLKDWKKVAPIRVHVATQPTFTRYTFPLSSVVGVASDRVQDGLTLVFDAPLRFDVADALVTLPPFIASIEPKLDEDTASVRFAFNSKVDVRTFREDNNYVVDVSATAMSDPNSDVIGQAIEELQRAVPPPGSAAASPATAPQTVPASAPPASAAPAAAPRAAAPAADQATKPAAPVANGAAKPAPPAPTPRVAQPNPPVPRQGATVQAPPARPSPPTTDKKNAGGIQSVPAAAPPAPPAVTPEQAGAPPIPSAQAQADPARPARRAPAASGTRRVKAEIKRYDNAVRVFFPFATETPAAVFRRADVMWLVFDSEVSIDIGALARPDGLIRSAIISQLDGQVLRLKLDRPRMSSLSTEGTGWALTISDSVVDPVKPIALTRTVVGPGRASVIVPFEDGRRLHRITDPDVGDTLFVVSALAPVRGVLKPQDFVELRALASTHGIAVQPLADDVMVQVAPERVVIGRPDGLTLSAHVPGKRNGHEAGALFDIEQWMRDRNSDFLARQSLLFNTAAAAPAEQQAAIHLNLARFFLAREMFFEAKGALDLALSTEHPKGDEAGMYVLRAIAKLMSGRNRDAQKDLSHPSVGNQHDAPLWRTVIQAQEGKWAEAWQGFKNAQMSIGMLPIELQRVVLQLSARAALEAGDIDGAASQLNDFETIGAPPDQQPTIAVLRGRIAEKLGRTGEALSAYQSALESGDRRAATQARLRQAVVRMSTNDLKRADAIAELETISVIWRGDETEIEALQLLARLYTEDGRLRDAFGVMRSALTANSRSDRTRSIQDDAAATFESLFLSGKGDALPAIDALSLFYDFRDLTPMGRRGDEMIRRLADRLVSVDLLGQASELLQHQVDNRLQGAARAQVATRLAMIYLMNNKSDRALAALRATHISGLSDTLRNRRLLLESRALTEQGRPDLALEVIGNIVGPEADRLRADILWKARRWRNAAEQLERVLGDRWRDWQPLSNSERNDVLRAGIGYALGEDPIGSSRLRDRYAAKMMDGPDRRAFDVVTSPIGTKGAEFGAIATNVGSIDTLERFLRDLRAGFSDLADKPPAPAPQAATPAPDVPAPRPAAPTTGQAPAAPVAAAAPLATAPPAPAAGR